ncbi:hypothetical protein THAOC_30518, partial [Thalassiosira oceanica]
MCKNEMKRRNEVEDRDLARGRQDRMYQSPSMHLRVQRFQRREIERLEKKQRRLEAAVIRMRAAAARVPNLDSEALLGDEAEFKRQYEGKPVAPAPPRGPPAVHRDPVRADPGDRRLDLARADLQGVPRSGDGPAAPEPASRACLPPPAHEAALPPHPAG